MGGRMPWVKKEEVESSGHCFVMIIPGVTTPGNFESPGTPEPIQHAIVAPAIGRRLR